MTIYTRQGDDGKTCLADGTRVAKDDTRVAAGGMIDELNSAVGVALSGLNERTVELRPVWEKIQNELMLVGADLATPGGPLREHVQILDAAAVQFLEAEIDRLSAVLPELTHFILPGGSGLGSWLHFCRTVCRHAERSVTRLQNEVMITPAILLYLNRLSDYLFVAARWVNAQEGVAENIWQK